MVAASRKLLYMHMRMCILNAQRGPGQRCKSREALAFLSTGRLATTQGAPAPRASEGARGRSWEAGLRSHASSGDVVVEEISSTRTRSRCGVMTFGDDICGRARSAEAAITLSNSC